MNNMKVQFQFFIITPCAFQE